MNKQKQKEPSQPFVEQVETPADDAIHVLLDGSPDSRRTTPAPIVTSLSPSHDRRIGFTIDNLVTPAECEALIHHTERLGYTQALLNVGGGRQILATDVRKSSRRIVDSERLAAALWERVAPYVPQMIGTEVVGLNERLRFLKYEKGDVFRQHMDGRYMRPDKSAASILTLQLYLNTNFTGGATTMWFKPNREIDLLEDKTQEVWYGVVPVVGRVAIFDHDILHEGAVVVEGVKYSMRTDIMYKYFPPRKPGR
ncbi:hypothetical protein HDU93_003963 [Gonapodya sp. JEL0774]|nr:hypothetical protein HDU93_003963 [Gonapodya sp. JEL0774]